MNHSDAPSTQEQARKRREEAQRLNIQKQALRIAQQRELTARQKGVEAAGKTAPAAKPKPLASRSVYSPPPVQPAPSVAATNPPPRAPARTKVVAAAPNFPRSPKKPVEEAASKEQFDPNDMRAEMQEYAHETALVPGQAVDAPAEPAASISADDIVIESPTVDNAPLSLATGESDLAREMNSVEIISSALSEPNAVRPALTKAETLKLKLLKEPDLACPKCGSLIPEAQRGAFYTECRRCGEIIKMNAA